MEIGRYLEGLEITPLEPFMKLKLDDKFECFSGRCSKHFGTDTMTYYFEVLKNTSNNKFFVDGFEATLLHIPKIQHSVFGRIDTKELEQKLSAIDWHMDNIQFAKSGQEVHDPFFDLLLLKQTDHSRAVEVADLLMLKYFGGRLIETTIENFPDATTHEVTYRFPISGDVNDYDAVQSYNLLSGRAVIKFDTSLADMNHSHWQVLENGVAIKLPFYDFLPLIRAITPIDKLGPDKRNQMLYEFVMGNQVPLTLIDPNGMQMKIKIEADPRNQSLIWYDEKNGKREYKELVPDTAGQKLPNDPSLKNKIIRRRTGNNRRGNSL